MSTIQDLFQQAQLAEAAYADFSSPDITVEQALINSGMPEKQASIFVSQWEVIDHLPNTDSGFSATVFHSRITGQYEFVIRGSENIATFDGLKNDWIATNSGGIGDLGVAVEQALDIYNYCKVSTRPPAKATLPLHWTWT